MQIEPFCVGDGKTDAEQKRFIQKIKFSNIVINFIIIIIKEFCGAL